MATIQTNSKTLLVWFKLSTVLTDFSVICFLTIMVNVRTNVLETNQDKATVYSIYVNYRTTITVVFNSIYVLVLDGVTA